MGVVDRIRDMFGGSKKEVAKAEAVTFDLNPLATYTRPVGAYVQMGISDVARVPYIPLGFRFCYDLYYYSDILRTIIRSLVQETFRNGAYVDRAYAVKCERCGSTFMDPVDVCPVCGNTEFRQPSEERRIWLENWMKNVNLNGQSLIEVLAEVSTDVNIIDNGFLVLRKRYHYNNQGELAYTEVTEVLRGDPLRMRLVISRDGRPARTDDGRMVVACSEHRDEYHVMSDEEYEQGGRCPKCGRKMLPVVAILKKGGKNVTYLKGEVLHIKKFTHGIGYGFPPVMTVWIKVMTLMKMDYFILMSYHLQRPPRGLLILRARREDVAKAWQWLMEQARLNPYHIYPLAIPPEVGNTRRVAEWIDLSVKYDTVQFIQYRDECRRQIGAVWGVMPIFQGDVSTGRGLANQGLQITVTNRAVEREQRIWNEKVLPWIMKQLGIDDWIIQLRPHEEKDMMAQLERETARVALAKDLIALGYQVDIIEGPDGLDIKIVGKDVETILTNLIEAILKQRGMPTSKKKLAEIVAKVKEVIGIGAGETQEMRAEGKPVPVTSMPPAPEVPTEAPPTETEVAVGEVTDEVREKIFGVIEKVENEFNVIGRRVERMRQRAVSGWKEEMRENRQWAREGHEGEVKDKRPRKYRQRFEGEETARRGGKEEKYLEGARHIEDLKEGEE